MYLVATLLEYGAPVALYCEEKLSFPEAWDRVLLLESGVMVFGPEFRLVLVGDEPPALVLPKDLSESTYEG